MNNKSNGYIYYNYHKKTEKEEIVDTAWKSVFNWLSVIVGIFAVLFFVCSIFFRVMIVDGDSMLPNLKDGEKILVYTFNYTPEAGDVVVAVDDTDTVLLKRVIAKENQTVDIDYNNSAVYVDSVKLREPYIYENRIKAHNDEIEYPHRVSKDCVFLMGDNRNGSMDSRSLNIGDIDADYVLGKVLFRISFDYKVN